MVIKGTADNWPDEELENISKMVIYAPMDFNKSFLWQQKY